MVKLDSRIKRFRSLTKSLILLFYGVLMKGKRYFILSALIVATANAEQVTLTDPIYFPGTAIEFSYIAWGCAGNSDCKEPSDFLPVRENFYGAIDYVNEDGVCRALGYQAAVANSSKSFEGSDNVKRLQVNDQGYITGALAGRSLNEITCIGPFDSSNLQTVTLIADPIDPIFGLPYSISSEHMPYTIANTYSMGSSEDRVCQRLGHRYAAIGSTLISYSMARYTSLVDAARVSDKGVVTVVTDAIPALSIICVD